MKILAFDSTGPIITVGAAEDGRALRRVDAPTQRGTGGILERSIDDVLSAVGWNRTSVQGLALVTGPGSLTAMRIGWATATGWAQSIGIPITGWPVYEIHKRFVSTEDKSGKQVRCATHFRGDTFLLYDLSGPSAVPVPIALESWSPQSSGPIVITGPGIIGRRDEWSRRLRVGDALADERDAIVGGDVLAVWGEEAIAKGGILSIESAPLDYGLPPDFKKLIVP